MQSESVMACMLLLATSDSTMGDSNRAIFLNFNLLILLRWFEKVHKLETGEMASQDSNDVGHYIGKWSDGEPHQPFNLEKVSKAYLKHVCVPACPYRETLAKVLRKCFLLFEERSA